MQRSLNTKPTAQESERAAIRWMLTETQTSPMPTPAANTLQIRPLTTRGRPVPLGGEPISIGRHPDNTFPLKDERASRFHCVIEPDSGGSFRVRDLGSRNGTKVNGDRVDVATIVSGDIVKVGTHEFRIESMEAAASADSHDGSGAAWERTLRDMVKNLAPDLPVEETIQVVSADGKPSDIVLGEADGPKAVRLLLTLSGRARATDIHLEPKGETFHVRMRIDGQMTWVVELPNRIGELVQGVIKAACLMKTLGRDAVIDGAFSARYPDRRVDYRASFTPSIHGQKLVLRILDLRDMPRSIAELGMAPYMLDRIRRTCMQDAGLLLVCGPTGSGKTTTLYNAIREIDRNTRNVVTIEDPVEYRLDGVTQIPIDEHRGNSFNGLLRSVLRQDPDVIYVGEIRDEETARTAMQAAMTGHVVFSTVHAKETISAVFRLLDLGVEPYLVANALDLVLAQRLLRVLCDNCKTPVPLTPGQITRMGKGHLQGAKPFHAVGCARCLKTGFKGRRAIFELLDFNTELRDIVLKAPGVQAMRKAIEAGHFTTLAQSAYRLVCEGMTSIDEAEKVAGGV